MLKRLWHNLFGCPIYPFTRTLPEGEHAIFTCFCGKATPVLAILQMPCPSEVARNH